MTAEELEKGRAQARELAIKLARRAFDLNVPISKRLVMFLAAGGLAKLIQLSAEDGGTDEQKPEQRGADPKP
jgi:hypothetical protein